MEAKESIKENKNSIPAVERTLEILELLSDYEDPSGIGFEEILTMTNLPRSTAFRILSTLERKAFVEKTTQEKSIKWKIGIGLMRIGLEQVSKMNIRSEAMPVMKWLSDETDEYVQLGVLFQGKVMYIEHIKRLKQLSMYAELGSLLHANLSAAGMVLLSDLSPTLIDQIISENGLPKSTEKTITSPEEFKNKLNEVRMNGYAIDDEMFAVGIRCIAAPIYDHSGKAIAAIGISGFASHISGIGLERKKNLVIEAGYRISERLGFKNK
ncbi:IclR family transcriptional regulator [Neobacillus sp. Marseille-QA0830]